jgi:ribosomal protein L11 methyltransferase
VIRLAVRVRHEQAEFVLAELLELAPAGVEEVQVGEETVEYAVYGSPGELPELPDVRAVAGDALVEVSTSEIADDWQERWKTFHRPVLIEAPPPRAGRDHRVPTLHVRPPWEAASARRGGEAEEIVIDPGQAFGTGGHASTRLCLELLLELAAFERPAGPLLDVGAGSGVLAIAAARLGFAPVLGLDHERESVQAAEKNAAANGVEIEVRRFDLRTQALPWMDVTPDSPGAPASPGPAGAPPGPASAPPRPAGAPPGPAGSTVVVANLLRPLLLELARTMPVAPAHLLAGGLLKEEVDEIADTFGERLGLRERERRESGEWAAVWLTTAR